MGASDLFRPIVSFGKTILHFLLPTMAATQGEPPYYAIPGRDGFRDAVDWFKPIQEGIRFPHDLDNVTISKVKWFKDNGGLAHECLVFTVNVKDPEYQAFLSIERSTTQEIVESALQGDALQVLSEATLAVRSSHILSFSIFIVFL